MAIAELNFLGGFELKAPGGPIAVPGQKDQAVLAVLALQPRATVSRERLAGMVWGDHGEVQARDSLKHSLGRLRECFRPGASQPLVVDRNSVGLDLSQISVDVVLFGKLADERTPEALERAVALYRGDFLDGIAVRDTSFQEWLTTERSRFRQSVEEVLRRLVDLYQSSGEDDRAEAAAHRLLLLDPLSEAACRALMRLEARRGQPAAAVKLYEMLRAKLARELGVEPEVATVQLYESIKRPRAPANATSAETGAQSSEAVADTERHSGARPSIAVLPFVNLSGDPAQDYFSDGIVEEIIAALSRMRWLRVMARNSSFVYKGRTVDVKQIGRELGVGYVLEGSLRKAEKRIRISGALIDTSTGVNLWADRFEGEIENVFDLQDRMTTSVIGAIAPKLEQAEIARARRKPPASLDAYDYYLRGLACVHQWTREANTEAVALFSRAIDLDPSYATAHGMAARCYSQRKSSGWSVDLVKEAREAERLARRAGELGKDDALALASAGIALAFVVGDLDSGVDFTDRAMDLDPNLASAWLFGGLVKIWMGEPDIACQRIERAMRLSPQDPHTFNMHAALGWAYFAARRYDLARTWAEVALRERSNLDALCVAAASSAMAGDIGAAQKPMAVLRRIAPSLRLSTLRDFFPTRRDEDFTRWREGLQAAGLPA
jgi:TolB-like protein/Tfp pilus assembly protein PilF